MSDDSDDGMVECANCEGMFMLEDMDADHCRECAAEIFGDDA